MIIFDNLLDSRAYNVFALWTEINPEWNKNILYRRKIYLELGKVLVTPYVESRIMLPRCEQANRFMKNVQAEDVGVPGISATNTKSNKHARYKF